MIFFIEEEDFSNMGKIRNINDNHYNKNKKKYDHEKWVNKLHDLIYPIKDKFKILEESFKNDLRFSNFEIGLSSIRPRGFRVNSYFWIWMVDKKKYQEEKNANKESPQLHLPQVQISINPFKFTAAEIWYESHSFEERIKLEKLIKKNPKKYKSKYDLIVNRRKNNTDEYLSTLEGDKFENVLNNFKNKYYPEAGIRKYYTIEEAIDYSTSFIDIIKNDIYDLIKNVFEPTYGKILNKDLEEILSNDKLRNEDNVVRKGTEEIEYERKHFKMQNKFKLYFENKELKVHIEEKRIDAVIVKENEIELVEMKPYKNVLQTLRESLGQIIAYNYIFKDSTTKKIHLTIAGMGNPNDKEVQYIKYLKGKIKLHLKYLYFDFESDNLRHKYY